MAKKKKPPLPNLNPAKPVEAPKRKRGAPVGSKNAEKFATAEERRAAYALYCLHIAAGYMGESFYEPCVEDTIQNLAKKYPDDFPPDDLKRARAKGRLVWEQMGFRGAAGQIRNFSANAWKFNMQNRLGWKDRQEHGFDKENPAVFTLRMGKDLGAKRAPDEDD